MWFLKNQSTSSSPKSEINLISESPNPLEKIPRDATNGEGVPPQKRGQRMENYWALKVFLDQLVQDGHLKEFMNE